MAGSASRLTPQERWTIRNEFAKGGVTIASLAREYAVDRRTIRRAIQQDAPLKPGPKKGDPRVVAAGRKGGQTTAARHSTEHFRALGEKGGYATYEKMGEAHYSVIGKRGGQRGGGARPRKNADA